MQGHAVRRSCRKLKPRKHVAIAGCKAGDRPVGGPVTKTQRREPRVEPGRIDRSRHESTQSVEIDRRQRGVRRGANAALAMHLPALTTRGQDTVAVAGLAQLDFEPHGRLVDGDRTRPDMPGEFQRQARKPASFQLGPDLLELDDAGQHLAAADKMIAQKALAPVKQQACRPCRRGFAAAHPVTRAGERIARKPHAPASRAAGKLRPVHIETAHPKGQQLIMPAA